MSRPCRTPHPRLDPRSFLVSLAWLVYTLQNQWSTPFKRYHNTLYTASRDVHAGCLSIWFIEMPVFTPLETLELDAEDLEVIPSLFEENPFLSTLLSGDAEAIERVLLGGFTVPTDATMEEVLFGSRENENESSSNSSSDDMSQEENIGRGHRGPRATRREREPYKSLFWTKYIERAMKSSPDDLSSIWNEDSYEGRQFRRRFALPYVMFNDIYIAWRTTGEYRREKDRVGRKRIDARLLILGTLRFLSKGTTFDMIDEVTDVSYQHNHHFLERFLRWFNRHYSHQYIKLPTRADEIHHVEGLYRDLGLPGCLGSTDVVHVGWDMCPAGMRSDCVGKEGYPTLAFEVVVSHTRYILGVTPAFYGTWNDKTISKFDESIQSIRNKEPYISFPWTYRDASGNQQQETGLYFIVDGGYNRWNVLMPPYKHQIEGTDEARWSKHVESLRKDVECTFGILKKRFAILKNRFRLHHKERISDIFWCCCILHNMLHKWDGYDDWEAVEAQVRQLEDESRIEEGDAITMRDRTDYYNDTGEDETEIDIDFDTRRGHLIGHFTYLRGQGYNVNRIR